MNANPRLHSSKVGHFLALGLPLAFVVGPSCVPDFSARKPPHDTHAGATGGDGTTGGDASGGQGAPGGDNGMGGSTAGSATDTGGGGTSGGNDGSKGGEAGDIGGSGTGGDEKGGKTGTSHGGTRGGTGAESSGGAGAGSGGNGKGGALPTGGAAGKAGGAGAGGMGAGGAGGAGAGAGGSAGVAGSAFAGAAGAGGGGNCDTGSVASWQEEFDTTSLAASWTRWDFPGTRRNGQSATLGRISLSANAGSLRYLVDPMVTPGFSDAYGGYQSVQNTYWYDPAVELYRALAGRRWMLETKVNWFVPLGTNAAGFYIAVDFGRAGPPDAEKFSCHFYRFDNDSTNPNVQSPYNRFGATCGPQDWTSMAELVPNITRYVRFERNDTMLSLRWSVDGSAWSDIAAVEIPEDVRCAPQRIVFSSHSWFNPGGSYADYDYFRFQRQD